MAKKKRKWGWNISEGVGRVWQLSFFSDDAILHLRGVTKGDLEALYEECGDILNKRKKK